MRILIVEDFSPLRDAVTQGLKESGYAVDSATNGEDGLRLATMTDYDVIVLDLMLPKIDGLTILQTLRAKRSRSYILILTARDTANDRVHGLNLGADDYLVKPFVFTELLARVRALLRRKYDSQSAVIRVGDLELETSHRIVRRGGIEISLTAREYALLEYLAMNVNRTVTRTEIWQHVYDFNATIESNVVDVYIAMLRKKLECRDLPRLIHTRRGMGYVLREGGEES